VTVTDWHGQISNSIFIPDAPSGTSVPTISSVTRRNGFYIVRFDAGANVAPVYEAAVDNNSRSVSGLRATPNGEYLLRVRSAPGAKIKLLGNYRGIRGRWSAEYDVS